MLSGLKNVTPDLANEIESFLGVPVDLIVETDRRQPQGRVSRVLDLLQGMYFTQALKERHFDQWFASLITVHREQVWHLFLVYGYVYMCIFTVLQKLLPLVNGLYSHLCMM